MLKERRRADEAHKKDEHKQATRDDKRTQASSYSVD